MDQSFNVVTAPKTATFQMRINPEVKRRVEAVYASQGLPLPMLSTSSSSNLSTTTVCRFSPPPKTLNS